MKNIALLLIIILIAVFLILYLSIRPSQSVTIENKFFNVDVAKTQAQQEKGLAIYDSLPIDRGMIFPFNRPGYYTFWMKDMKFPIDIIYIKNDNIVDIFSNVPPPTSPTEQLPIIKPKSPSDTVLEINAGLSKKYNFKIGDKVKINY